LVSRGVLTDFVGSIENVPVLTKISSEVRIKAESDVDWEMYSVVVLDSYNLEPEYALQIKSFGPQIVVIADDATPPLPADLYIEPGVNLWWQPPLGHEHIRRLRGPKFALIRNELWAKHNCESFSRIEDQTRVLVLLGGSGMSPYLLPLLTVLDSLSLPLIVTAVSALPRIRQERFHHIDLTTSAPRHDLENLLDVADVVISAAGVTSWEVLSSGKPLGIIAVVDNQEPNYVFMSEAAIAAPLGRVYLNETIDPDRLRKLLEAGPPIESMAAHASELVDGKGASRVVDAIVRLTK
jgi:spore coat polysaccharide biosynthesis predicted glycosyltransferase SpsG